MSCKTRTVFERMAAAFAGLIPALTPEVAGFAGRSGCRYRLPKSAAAKPGQDAVKALCRRMIFVP